MRYFRFVWSQLNVHPDDTPLLLHKLVAVPDDLGGGREEMVHGVVQDIVNALMTPLAPASVHRRSAEDWPTEKKVALADALTAWMLKGDYAIGTTLLVNTGVCDIMVYEDGSNGETLVMAPPAPQFVINSESPNTDYAANNKGKGKSKKKKKGD